MTSKISFFASVTFAFLGFLDATYLTIIHYKNLIPPCSIAHGCETVLTSRYATIGPVPIALIGVFFYLSVLILLFLFLQTKKRRIINLTFFLSVSCIAVAAVLVYLQAFVLHAYCQYCLVSEGLDVALFFSVWNVWHPHPISQES
ncbi:MAG: vitamin K epoxide reductase family protein [Patescibacteria group bacterium]|nr:vitamin K epoxide reductase family protein [Patescibacteria group bacterium]MDE2589505.1 vitamin K epoxide reductase family protein [Patescibacteria group bacterium]